MKFMVKCIFKFLIKQKKCIKAIFKYFQFRTRKPQGFILTNYHQYFKDVSYSEPGVQKHFLIFLDENIASCSCLHMQPLSWITAALSLLVGLHVKWHGVNFTSPTCPEIFYFCFYYMRSRDTHKASIWRFTPQVPAPAGLRHAKARSWELNPGLPLG